MKRVIPDSDEESDGEIELESAPVTLPTKHTSKSPTRGTGSTESLKRAFASAHHAQFHSQPRQIVSQVIQSHANAQAVDVLPKYQGQDSNLDYELNLVETDTRVPNGPLSANLDHHSQSQDGLMGLIGTLHDEFASHEPMEMFPEASSTVPNATATQMRLLEQRVGFTGYHGSIVPDPVRRASLEPSVSLSDILNLSPSSALGPTPRFPASTFDLSLPLQPVTTASAQQHRFQDDNNPSPWTQSPRSTTRDKHGYAEASHNSKLLNTPVDEPKVSESASQPKPLSMPQIAQSKSVEPSHSLDISSGIFAADFAMSSGEQSARTKDKRSSRSKSQNVSAPSIDSSTRRPKRRRTAPMSALSTPEKVNYIRDMGFTSPQAADALQQYHGDFEMSIDWLLRQGTKEDDAIALPVQSESNALLENIKEDDRIKSVDQELFTDVDELLQPQIHSATETNAPTSTKKAKKSSKVEIRNTKKPTSTTAMHDPPQEACDDEARPGEELLDQSATAAESHYEKHAFSEVEPVVQRKRGRPRKVPAAEQTAMLPQEQAGQHQQIDTEPGDGEVQQPKPPGFKPERQEISTVPVKEVSHNAKSTIIEPKDERPNTAKSISSASAIKPATPLANPQSRVPHRVGLSKRARIAPLLRVVKK